MAAQSYLTSGLDWLMQDMGGLMASTRSDLAEDQQPMSEHEFKQKYYTGSVNPAGAGDVKYHFDYDAFGDEGYGTYGSDYGMMFGGGKRTAYEQNPNVSSKDDIQGYYVSGYSGAQESQAITDAYNKYLEIIGFDPSVQTAEEFAVSPVAPGSVNWFDKESVISSMEKAQGAGGDRLSRSVGEFTPEMFRKLRPEYYQEDVTEGRGTLLDRLYTKMRTSQSLGSGLAGYGGRSRAASGAREEYLTGMEDVYTDINKQRASALQDIYSLVEDYSAL